MPQDNNDPPSPRTTGNPGPLILPRPKRDWYLQFAVTGILIAAVYIAYQVREIKKDLDKQLPTRTAMQEENI